MSNFFLLNFFKFQHMTKLKYSFFTLLFLDTVYRKFDTISSDDISILLDFAKAFDKVPHHFLIKKLESFDVGGNLLLLLHSYLEDRKQCQNWKFLFKFGERNKCQNWKFLFKFGERNKWSPTRFHTWTTTVLNFYK